MRVKILKNTYTKVIEGMVVDAIPQRHVGSAKISGKLLNEVDPTFWEDDKHYYFFASEVEVQDE